MILITSSSTKLYTAGNILCPSDNIVVGEPIGRCSCAQLKYVAMQNLIIISPYDTHIYDWPNS